MKALKIIDYAGFVAGTVAEDHRIGNDIFLLDERRLNSVPFHEFVAVRTTFIEVLNGSGEMMIDGVEYKVNGHCLIGYLAGQHIVSRIRKSVQRGVMFSDSFMEDLYLGAVKYHDLRNSVISNPVFQVDASLAHALSIYIAGLKYIASRDYVPNDLLSAKYLTLSLFYSPLNVKFKAAEPDRGTSRSPKISDRFLYLLQENYRSRYGLDFYAAKLNISVRYLYTSVTASTGKSPKQWINQTLVSESKRLLEDPDFSIFQVSQMLNFSSLQSFGKFFRIQTGMSPRDFRKGLVDGGTVMKTPEQV